MRYFRAIDAVYLAVGQLLDQRLGYPRGQTLRTLPPLGEIPRDSVGRVYLALTNAECSGTVPAELLPSLLASGAVQEITRDEYDAAMPRAPF